MLLLFKPCQAYCWQGINDSGGFLHSNMEDFLCSHGFNIYYLQNLLLKTKIFHQIEPYKKQPYNNDCLKSEPYKKLTV
jgi:hypothetical protein